MSKPMCGIGPHWKVRINIARCGVTHLISRTEPKALWEDGHISGVDMNLITGTEYGDTIGYIDWREVVAVTWRWAV